MNGVVGLVKAAKLFRVPIVSSLVQINGSNPFPHPAVSELLADDCEKLRTSVSVFGDTDSRSHIESFNARNLLVAGLAAETSLTPTALEALGLGYNVHVVTDACSNRSMKGWSVALDRMIQAGVVPVTWSQVAVEWQSDWAKLATGQPLLEIFKAHNGPLTEFTA